MGTAASDVADVKRGRDDAKHRLLAALEALEQGLTAAGLPHVIIGGFAVIAHGVARTTRDLDATIPGEGIDLDEVLGALATSAIAPRIEDPLGFARRTQMLLLQHEPSGVLIDLSLAWLPFELDAIRGGVRTRMGAGLSVPLARPEDLVVYKAVAWRPIDRKDIDELLLLHLDQIDLPRVRHVIEQLAEALDDTDRLAGFDEAVRRAKRSRGKPR